MLVGVSGKIGSGKTTLANIACNTVGAKKISFAGLLKCEVEKFLLDHDAIFIYENLYGTQEEKEEVIEIPTYHNFSEYFKYGLHNFISCTLDGYYQTTGRKLMQWWGTEYRRQQNPEYWTQLLLECYHKYEDSDLVIVDDVRFPNEADTIKLVGGYLIRIQDRAMSCSTHLSEVSLDNYKSFDITIRNNRSLEDFIALCHDAITLVTSGGCRCGFDS